MKKVINWCGLKLDAFFEWLTELITYNEPEGGTVEIGIAPGHCLVTAGEDLEKGWAVSVGPDGLLYGLKADEARVGVAHDDIAKNEICQFEPSTGELRKVKKTENNPYDLLPGERLLPFERVAIDRKYHRADEPIWKGDALSQIDQPHFNAETEYQKRLTKHKVNVAGKVVTVYGTPTGRSDIYKRFLDSLPGKYTTEPVLPELNEEKLQGLHTGMIFQGDPQVQILARVYPNFNLLMAQPPEPINDGDILGNVYLEDGKLMVQLDNYYDHAQLRQAFGQIEFMAVDFLPAPEGLSFEYGGAIKKFHITNWVLTNVPAEPAKNVVEENAQEMYEYLKKLMHFIKTKQDRPRIEDGFKILRKIESGDNGEK